MLFLRPTVGKAVGPIWKRIEAIKKRRRRRDRSKHATSVTNVPLRSRRTFIASFPN